MDEILSAACLAFVLLLSPAGSFIGRNRFHDLYIPSGCYLDPQGFWATGVYFVLAHESPFRVADPLNITSTGPISTQ